MWEFVMVHLRALLLFSDRKSLRTTCKTLVNSIALRKPMSSNEQVLEIVQSCPFSKYTLNKKWVEHAKPEFCLVVYMLKETPHRISVFVGECEDGGESETIIRVSYLGCRYGCAFPCLRNEANYDIASIFARHVDEIFQKYYSRFLLIEKK